MKYIAKFSMIAAVLLGLGGCVTAIDPAQNGGATRSNGGGFPMIGGSLTANDFPQICQAAKDNPIKARETFNNRRFSASGEVIIIDNGIGIMEKYHVAIRTGKFTVHAGTNNSFAVKSLSVGKPANVSGTIDYVSNDYDGCSVSLRNASF